MLSHIKLDMCAMLGEIYIFFKTELAKKKEKTYQESGLHFGLRLSMHQEDSLPKNV